MYHAKILIVDDEPQILKLLTFLLRDEGYDVTGVSSGEQAIIEARKRTFDLAILDITLPGMDGYETCLALEDLKVLFLSSHNEQEKVIKGLKLGALDYIRKPFDSQELILKVANLVNTIQSHNKRRALLQSGDLSLDPERERVLILGRQIHLSPTEFSLLKLLMTKQSMVVSFEEILEEVWGDPHWAGGRQMIKVNIKRLRSKIEKDPQAPSYILNHWGRGYLFAPQLDSQ